jgi:hypothetical protein
MTALKGVLGAYVMMGLSVTGELKTQQEEKKKWVLEEWERSKNYPRKKKKQVRKELQLDWSIACWNPFEN